MNWLDHVEKWKDCQRCPLGQQRSNICLARGTVPCDVLFIGEAPGVSEDTFGLPFVGPAGQLLDQIILRTIPSPDLSIWDRLGMHLSTPWWVVLDTAKEQGLVIMETVWITHALTNLVACFPRNAKTIGENEPEYDEILECQPRLIEFVNLAQPKLIVCVGKLAANYVDHGDTVTCVDIDHPAYILRMSIAQRQMATQKCIVVLRNAVEDILNTTKPFRNWGENKDASSKTHRENLRNTYGFDGSDIPY